MSILFAILLFSFLIFIHELGHFIAAKLSKVQVNEFSMFMGPAIFKKKVGETLYSIRCIPLGGYCSMEGEDGGSDNPRSFDKAAWWKRLIILVAGAGMNFIAGLILLLIVFAPSEQYVTPVIDQFEPGCTLNGEAGLQEGDRFYSIDGQRILLSSDVTMFLQMYPSDHHDVVVIRDGNKVALDDFEMLKHEFTNEDGTKSMRYGFSFRLVDATFGETLDYVWNSAMNTVRSVKLSLEMLLRGDAGLQDMTGPVGIVQYMSETANASDTTADAVINLLYFGAFIAINLSVMNLLPIPALDGGRVVGLLLTTIIEAIIRRKINPKYEGYIHGVGMVILLALMGIIMFKDIFMIFKG